jgi:hypothetical protein
MIAIVVLMSDWRCFGQVKVINKRIPDSKIPGFQIPDSRFQTNSKYITQHPKNFTID